MDFGSKQMLDAIRLSEQSLSTGSGELKKMVIFVTETLSQSSLEYIKRLEDRNIEVSLIALSPPMSRNDFRGLDPRLDVIMLSRDNFGGVIDITEIFIVSGWSLL